MKDFIKILRFLHAWTGFIFSIFFISSAFTGIILIFRQDIPKNLKDLVFTIHTLEIGILKYFLIIVGIALIGLSISGTILFFLTRIKKKQNID